MILKLVLTRCLLQTLVYYAVNLIDLHLTLTWVGLLGLRFEVVMGGVVKLPPCLKLVRNMLETSNLARKYTPVCSFRKYTF